MSDQPRPTPIANELTKSLIDIFAEYAKGKICIEDVKFGFISEISKIRKLENESDAREETNARLVDEIQHLRNVAEFREERIRELEGLLETARIISSDSCKLLEEAGGTIKAHEAENAKLRETLRQVELHDGPGFPYGTCAAIARQAFAGEEEG